MTRARVWLIAASVCLALPAPAAADLVHLKNGRVLSVESGELKVDQAILVFRDGGRMQAPQSMIEEVLPDEYPRVKAGAPSVALGVAPAGSDIQVLVETAAARYGIDVKLAQALVRVESNYYPRAVSPKGAKGLMQLMPSIAQQYAVSDVFNPAENLDAGMRHLRGLLDRFKDNVSFALAAYNAGLFAVTKYGGVPPYRETQDYVRRILALAR
jgi:soluble lytic murein transglycosylase-like protein